MERALRRRAVAEERHGDPVVAAQLRCGPRSHRDGQARGHDPICAEDPEFRVGDVHGTTAAAVRPLVLGHQLGEHPERVHALGEAVAVATVGRRDDIGRAQWPARAHRRRLLPDREVHEAGHLTVPIERGHPLFETADEQHPAVHLDELDVRERGVERNGPAATKR